MDKLLKDGQEEGRTGTWIEGEDDLEGGGDNRETFRTDKEGKDVQKLGTKLLQQKRSSKNKIQVEDG